MQHSHARDLQRRPTIASINCHRRRGVVRKTRLIMGMFSGKNFFLKPDDDDCLLLLSFLARTLPNCNTLLNDMCY